jgi:curli biogenesis system outer membrane secretion channel CsgG
MPRTALKRLFLLFAFRCSAPAVLLFALPAVAQNQSSKKHVAVLNFDSPSVSPGGSSGLFGADASEVGKGVSAQLIVRLLAYGKYSVLDRDALQKILKEQKQADTTGLDAYALACKVGRIANLDALIIGAVTRYGPDDLRVPSASGMHTRKSKAFV